MSAAPATTVRLPDGSTRELESGATGADLAAALASKLRQASKAIAVKINSKPADLNTPLPDGATVELIAPDTPEGRYILRHSTAHVLAQAVTDLWPGAKYAIGPPIEDGFYYDFDLPDGERFHPEDLPRIEERMRAIIAEAQPFIREEHSTEDALANLFEDQPYKREIIEGAAAGNSVEAIEGAGEGATKTTVSAYRNTDNFVDLCRGPHVPSTRHVGHFRLTRLAAAYWRGDEHRQQLQRIYGTAWESEKALTEYLRRLEEAEKRDHRRLGAELDLFSFPAQIGSGLAVFHPKGALVRMLMEDYSKRRHLEEGYQFVSSPHLAKAELFHTSGHLDWYADGMYPPMELDEGQRYYLKPMNCPFHILVYGGHQRSYRELPMRLFEFGTVYRYEKSGVVHGLTRARGFAQDDSHIFCTTDQLEVELESVTRFVLGLLRDFGLADFYLELSTKPETKAVGADAEWDRATQALRASAANLGLDLVLDEGGGAFYGPKISVQARDAIGRHWQVSTIQLDFQEPQRFDLEYVGADNERHRPVMIHRALFGSVERFLAILLEHYAGNLPTWLAPVQARVLPVRDDHQAYAEHVAAKLRTSSSARADVDEADEPLGARVRRAKLEKIPYVLVVGDDDVGSATVGVNQRGKDRPDRGIPLSEFALTLKSEIESRSAGPQPQ